MIWWTIIVVCLAASTILLYLFLLHQQTQHKVWEAMEEKAAELRRLVQPLEKEPQSGMWIKCQGHGDIPLTQAEFDKQEKAGKFTCPFCGHIPKRIWRRL